MHFLLISENEFIHEVKHDGITSLHGIHELTFWFSDFLDALFLGSAGRGRKKACNRIFYDFDRSTNENVGELFFSIDTKICWAISHEKLEIKVLPEDITDQPVVISLRSSYWFIKTWHNLGDSCLRLKFCSGVAIFALEMSSHAK